MGTFNWSVTFGELLVLAGFVITVLTFWSKQKDAIDARFTGLVARIELAAEKRTEERDRKLAELWAALRSVEDRYLRLDHFEAHTRTVEATLKDIREDIRSLIRTLNPTAK